MSSIKAADGQYVNVLDLIEKSVPAEHLVAVQKALYGGETVALPIPAAATKLAQEHDFEVKSYALPKARAEEKRPQRLVRVAAIQNPIYAPTTASVAEQYKAIEKQVGHMVDAAAAMGANVVGLQEAWTCPFFFCTRERMPWLEFAETVANGESVRFLQSKAKQHNMVIVSSILEIDENHADTIWNTAVVISNSGAVLGKVRKYHIPRVLAFAESSYYFESQQTPPPVFATQFGTIGVNICYGRHFPQHWHILGLHGAEIVFNPSATVDGLSEPLWGVEARNAAVANGYFSVAINRVGTETYPNEFTIGDGKPAHKDFGHFYGSSYVSGPTGQRTPSLSRTQAGVLVTEIDLNLNRQTKNHWGFHMTARWDDYVKMYTEQAKPDFVPNVIVDPLVSLPPAPTSSTSSSSSSSSSVTK